MRKTKNQKDSRELGHQKYKPVSHIFKRSVELPKKTKLKHLKEAQARWMEMTGEVNENLETEINKLKLEMKNEK